MNQSNQETQATYVKKPQARTRKRMTCADWLGMLEPGEIKERWAKSGYKGLYAHERLWMARYCPFPEVRHMAQADLREKEDAKQARQAAAEAQKQVVEAERQENLVAIRGSIAGLDAETHGTVRAAAHRASELYTSQHIPRSLKQCVAIASAEHLVAFGAVQSYLAGVGVRVLWARVSADDVWEETDGDLPTARLFCAE